MNLEFPKFAYQDGKVLAFHGNELIASGTEFAKVAETAEEYFSALRSAKLSALHERATHVTTPNGVRGQILNKVATVWGDEITVRLANGEIRHYATTGVDDGFTYSVEDTAKQSMGQAYLDYFQRRFDEMEDHDIRGLTARLDVLDGIKNDIRNVISSVPHADQQRLDQIVLMAEAERIEIGEALEHLVASDAEAYMPPAPLVSRVVEQGDFGGFTGDWLEITAREMIAESEAQDFDKLLAEGPTEFVSSLDTPALASTGTTAQMARDHIISKTAGFQGEAIEDYRDRFVAASEMARRYELAFRQDETKKVATKEASVVENVPDESLFL